MWWVLWLGSGGRGDWTAQRTQKAKPHSLFPRFSHHPDLEAEASLPEKKGNTLSRDLIDYVHYMVENHGEDYKVSRLRPRGLAGKVPQTIRGLICLCSTCFLKQCKEREEKETLGNGSY